MKPWEYAGLMITSLIAAGILLNAGSECSQEAGRQLADKLAYSELLWARSAAERPSMLTAYGDDIGGKRFPEEFFHPFNPFDFLRPAYNCPHSLERMGYAGDGGKWVCGMEKYAAPAAQAINTRDEMGPLTVYSFGVKDDSSFEDAFLQRSNGRIWGFDPFVSSWGPPLNGSRSSPQRDRAMFRPIGVGGQQEMRQGRQFKTLRQLMAENGHQYIDLVKMDVEGDEFHSLLQLLHDVGEDDLPFGQLLLEVHLIPADLFPTWVDRLKIPDSIQSWLAFWGALEAKGLRVVSSEPNAVGIMGVGRGQMRFVEASFPITLFERRRDEQL